LGQVSQSVHSFCDDALGSHDATGVAALIRSGAISAEEAVDASIARAEKMQPLINPIERDDFARARRTVPPTRGAFAGVPTFVKDNVDVADLPTGHGTDAFTAKPAKKDSPFLAHLRDQGLVILGKSRLPEFGFSASTEYADREPVHNPWNTDFSAGASSGGAAALVASGVVPIAHANDGGGSIRIPAAACGLVGLKPTRGRLIQDSQDKLMPVRIVSQGVVTRTVRDTAGFFAAAEQTWRNSDLPPVRNVTGPSNTRLRVGLVLDSVTEAPTDEETRAAINATVDLLEGLGHHVEAAPLPIDQRFADDFSLYWGMLGLLISTTGQRALGPDFDVARTDNLTKGLAAMARKEFAKTPGVLMRLRRSARRYREMFTRYDVLLSPVLAHTTPRLGHLSPAQPFEVVFGRLLDYVAFTPLQNATGGPAISLPLGRSAEGLPIGVQFASDLGDERTLLELAYELEAAQPGGRFPSLAE
jgi:amidase